MRFSLPLALLCTALAFSAKGQLTSTNLPIISITTPGGGAVADTQAPAVIAIIDNASGTNTPADPPTFSGPIGLRHRGSAAYPKRSYNVETWGATPYTARDTALLGMPRENDWVLLALYPDRSLMRPLVGFGLYAEMGFYAPRMRLVEVLLNGDYRGVYLWGERVKRGDDRVDIANLALTDNSGVNLTGGYIFQIDENDDGAWTSSHTPPGRSGLQTIQFHYVDPEDNRITAVQKAYIKSYTDSFEAALAGPDFMDTALGWRRHGAQRWFTDYLILQEAVGNEEAYRQKTYLYKDKAKKLRVGPPWGHELSLGNTASCNADKDTAWMWRHGAYCSSDTYLPPFWWGRLLEDTLYLKDLKCRYTELRGPGGPLDTARLFFRIDSMAVLLNAAGAQARNFTEYPIFGVPLVDEPTPMTTDHAGEVARIKDYLRARILFLDGQWKQAAPCAYSFAVADAVAGALEAALYPNPASGAVQLSYTLASRSTVTLSVRSAVGGEVLHRTAGREAGKTVETVQTEGWPAGLYVVSLRTESGAAKVMKLVVH